MLNDDQFAGINTPYDLRRDREQAIVRNHRAGKSWTRPDADMARKRDRSIIERAVGEGYTAPDVITGRDPDLDVSPRVGFVQAIDNPDLFDSPLEYDDYLTDEAESARNFLIDRRRRQ